MSGLRRVKGYGKYIVEFLAVLLGVLVAFWLSAWQDKREDVSLQNYYLSEFKDALDKDLTQLDEVVEVQSEALNLLTQFLEADQLSDLGSEQEVGRRYMQALLLNDTFFPDIATYRSLVESGRLDVIQDQDLTDALVALYEISYVRLTNFGDVLDGEIEKVNWEMRHWYNMYDQEFNSQHNEDIEKLRALWSHRFAYVNTYLHFIENTRMEMDAVNHMLSQ